MSHDMCCTVGREKERVSEKQAEFGLLNTEAETKLFNNIRDLHEQLTQEDSTKVISIPPHNQSEH